MDRSDWRVFGYRYGPFAILFAIMAFMLWVRLMPYDRVINSSAVFFSGNDPWYHSRMVQLIVDHFPASPNFDPWSRFPYGTGRHSGFGGLFDQLIAVVALILGLGSPSAHFVSVLTALAPPVFGAITVITVYFITRLLTDRWAALITAGLLAILGGQFLSRTVVGVSDHQSAEAFFGSLAILGFLWMVKTVYAEKPMMADIRDRNLIVLRRPLIASITGGAAIASYLMMWGPGVMLAFAMGVFVILQLIRDHWDDRPIDYLVFGTTVTMGTAGTITLTYTKTLTLDATAFSLLQPFVLFGIAGGAIVLYKLSEYIDTEGYRKEYYPIAVLGLIGGFLIVSAVIYPRVIDLLWNLIKRIYSFGLLRTPSALTVAEIQPANFDDAWRSYGAVFYMALVGGMIMLYRTLRDNHPLELVVLLWSYTIFSAYFSMIRFGYYMAVNVAILAAFAIWWVARSLLAIEMSIENPSELQLYQVLGILVILIAVIPGNVVAVSGHQPVWQTAERMGGSNQAWHNELTWMQNGTPKEPLDYTAQYNRPADGDFDYPANAYGVMSWWDYGHWITVQGHRIPFANPFQQGPRPASAYLQAQNETKANLILEALPSMNDRNQSVEELSTNQLRSIVSTQSQQEANENIRYVMIDDQMAAGKFGAIATWTGPGFGSYVSTQQVNVGEQTAQLPALNSRYQNMMLSRLYFQDANGLSHYRLVHETEQQSTIVSVARRTQGGWQSTNFFNRILRPGIFNRVQQSPNLAFYDVRRESRVKTFERVEGATLRGNVDTENQTTVFATLRLRTNTGRNFSYVRRIRTDANGEFAVTVPYATNNEVQPADGGTDSAIVAQGNYTLYVGNPLRPSATANVEVPESAIYDGTEITVEFTKIQRTNRSTTENNTSSSIVAPEVLKGKYDISPKSVSQIQQYNAVGAKVTTES